MAPQSGPVIVGQAPKSAIADYFTGDLTPDKLKSVLSAAASGDIATQNQMFDTMLERDSRLRSVYETRRMALTGLDWQLMPSSEVSKSTRINPTLAEKMRAYCLDVLAEIAGFEQAVNEMTDAIGRGVMVCEVVWDSQVPIEMQCLSAALLTGDSQDLSKVRVLTDADSQGVDISHLPPGKFIQHAPATIGGNRFRGGLLRPAMLGFMLKRYGLRWWFDAIERFGTPMTIAKYGQAADAEVRKKLLEMIRDMGVSRGGVFPAGCDVELVEMAKGSGSAQFPHAELIKYVDAEFAIEMLGQELTTAMSESGGSYAAAAVHDRVRGDLLAADIRNERNTLREQLLVPLCVLEFGEEARGHAPYFGRVIEEVKDKQATATLISTAVNELGAEIPASVVETELGVPLVEGADREAALPGRVTESPFGMGAMKRPLAGGRGSVQVSHGGTTQPCGCEVSAHSALATIAKRGSAMGRLSAWIIAAAFASTAHSQNVIAAVQAMIERRERSDRSGDLSHINADLPGMIDSLPVEDLVELQRQFILAGRLAGVENARQKVTTKSTKNAKGVRSLRGLRGSTLSAHADRIDFPALPFVEAIVMLRDRLNLTPEQFESLDAQARSRAFRVAGLWNMQMLADVHNALTASMERGETVRDFRLALPQMGEQRGWTGENPWHASVVHFQNFAMAHAAGRLGEYVDYGVERWRFVSVGESCPICEPMIGKVFAMSDRRFYPPLHFWCDCEEEPVFEGEAAAGETADSLEIINPALDQEQARPSGFKWDVAAYANLEPVDLTRFPEPLRAAFEGYAKANGWDVE